MATSFTFSSLRRGRLLLGLAGLIALADAALARDAAADILIFEHVQFRGRGVSVGGVVPNLNDYGFNDRISSIRVFRGAWQVCEHAHFQGRCVVIDRDVYDLSQVGLNDRVSSIRPVRPSRGGGNWGNDWRRWGK